MKPKPIILVFVLAVIIFTKDSFNVYTMPLKNPTFKGINKR